MTRQLGQFSRRVFVKGVSAAVAGSWILPNSRSAWSYQANERLNLAIIGAGRRGQANLEAVTGENIVVICDVDERRAAHSFAMYPQAKKYHDYRRLLDEMDREVDAVVVSTPNHHHAPASVMAMRRGKHVYCEKPGAHSVYEARLATEVAAEQQVATQLGTQCHSSAIFRQMVDIIREGVIGEVREFHAWQRTGGRGGRGDRPTETLPVPEGLDWDLWLGPAPYRPYHPVYSNGHMWWDFGGGVLGNNGCHYFDPAFAALELGTPESIEAEGPPPHPESTPNQQHVRYHFPARRTMPPVTLTWTHGAEGPAIFMEHPFPVWRDPDPSPWGVFVGSEGMLLVSYAQWRLWPEEKYADYQPSQLDPEPDPAAWYSADHHAEWIAACKKGSATSCHFGYSGPITEAVLLGNVAYRSAAKLEWDAAGFEVTNVPEANESLRRDYRAGWTL